MENYYTFISPTRDYAEAKPSSEAQEFIKNLPDNFVKAQISAITKAINGDIDELTQIRLGRITEPLQTPEVSLTEAFIKQKSGTDLRVRIYKPLGNFTKPLALLIYYHGGGWTIGCPESCERICRNYCAQNSAIVIAPDYRLAPEHPYPAANDDCFLTYIWALKNAKALNIDTSKITLAGDSAGGHLAIETALKIGNSPEIANKAESVIAFYPVTDLTDTSRKSYKFFGEKFCLNGELMKLFIKAYAPNEKIAKDASPLYKDLSKLPRILILTSECDVLRDEGKALYEKLKSLDKQARLICVEGATHLYITQAKMDKAFEFALKEASEFASKRQA